MDNWNCTASTKQETLESSYKTTFLYIDKTELHNAKYEDHPQLEKKIEKNSKLTPSIIFQYGHRFLWRDLFRSIILF